MASSMNRAMDRTTRTLGFKDFFSGAYKFAGFSILAALPFVVMNLDDLGGRLHYDGILSFLWSLLWGIFVSVLEGILIAGSTIWYGLSHASDLISDVRIGTILFVLFFGITLVFTVYQPVKIIGKMIEKSFNAFLAFGIALLVTIGFSAIAYYASDGTTISSGMTSSGDDTSPAVNETAPTTDSPSYAPVAALDLNEAGA